MEQYEKKGYLNSEFRLFHLTDQETKEIDYHYHDFDKITIFIRGKVNYMMSIRYFIFQSIIFITIASRMLTPQSSI